MGLLGHIDKQEIRYDLITVDNIQYMGAFVSGFTYLQNLYLPFYREGYSVILRYAPPYVGDTSATSSGEMYIFNGTSWTTLKSYQQEQIEPPTPIY